MESLSTNELSEICIRLGKTNLINTKLILGGCINKTWKLEFQDSSFFLKKNTRNKRLLKFEKYCLQDLKKYINSDSIIIPQIINYFEFNEIEYLILDWIDLKNINQKKLGKGLAEIHLNSNKKHPNKFGYSIEGYIGSTKQKKGWKDNWVDCFVNLRIKPQLSLLKNNDLNKKLMDIIISKIKFILSDHKPMNSLVHGDFWSGNVGSCYSGKGIIFDPSCWWADAEARLAITLLKLIKIFLI